MVKPVKALFLLIALLGMAGNMAAQSIPNGGFETWDTFIVRQPTSYQTTDTVFTTWPHFAPDVIQTTDAQHGLYAVMLKSTVSYIDTIISFISTNSYDPLNARGGLLYTQKPTGIRLYYKCNLAPGDSGTVIIIFKKSGTVIGSYIYKMAASYTGYTLFSTRFSPALSTTPDTVIFAAFNGTLNANTWTFDRAPAPGSYFNIDSVTFTGVSNQPTGFNGDFENWRADTLYGAHGWQYFSSSAVTRTTDAYKGHYALKLITVDNTTVDIVGLASTSDIFATRKYSGGYPYTHSIDTLEFYYKYAPATITDTAVVSLFFKTGGSLTGSIVKLLPSAASYTRQQVPFNLGTSPDSVIVSVSSSKGYTKHYSNVASQLLIDNIHFTSQYISGIANLPAIADGFLIYPNPMQEQFTLDMATPSPADKATVQVLNLLGQVVCEQMVDNVNYKIHALINLSTLPTGVYLVKITVGGINTAQRIIINN